MIIWILDCSNGCVTKINLSAEKRSELDKYFNNGGDAWTYIEDHADEFGINANSSSFMISDNEHVYEVEY